MVWCQQVQPGLPVYLQQIIVFGMSSESEKFRAELERLKSKYRKEALRAIEAAKSAAYEQGRKDQSDDFNLNKVTEESASHKVICGVSSAKSISLVQHIVEQVYRDMKQEFVASEHLSHTKLKV